MKQNRRRRHLRPGPTRAQITQQLGRLRSALNLFRTEWLMEARQEQPSFVHLRFVHAVIVEINDEIAAWEQA
jgi:hypothetical protein